MGFIPMLDRTDANAPGFNSKAESVNVLIVGAGPSGIGVARILDQLGVSDVVLLEKDQVAASFLRWPKEMRFISPSFPSNAFGLTDLNSITYDSSPAYALRRTHPSGKEYADYVRNVGQVLELNVAEGTRVLGIEKTGKHFVVHTDRGLYRANFVVWAAGQFSYPHIPGFKGSELGLHSSKVRSWRELEGDEMIVVGGYESGVDAALSLAEAGRKVTLLGRTPTWDDTNPDPSISLSPATHQRLVNCAQIRNISFVGDADIVGFERNDDTIQVFSADGRSWQTQSWPILATGFNSSTKVIANCFDYDADGSPLINERDESTRLSDLFLVGPEVKHRDHLFCYIYKFRQRFAMVADSIAERLGLDRDIMDQYRLHNMFLEDLSCCDEENCLC